MKKLEKVFAKINKALTKSERESFNKIRSHLYSGIDLFNMPDSHLRNIEKEGLERIKESLSMIPILACNEGKDELWYFGEANHKLD